MKTEVMTPRARQQGIVVKELPDELLVYDTERHRAHCLNRTAALVWKHCDGGKSVEQIAELLRAELEVPDAEELVWWALHRLGKARLLTEPMSPPPEVARYSRRELVRRLGLVGGMSVLIPVVSSIVAPTPAEAAGTCVSLIGCGGQPLGTPCGPTCTNICDGLGNCV